MHLANFPQPLLYLLCAGVVIALAALWMEMRSRHRSAIILLTLAALCVRSFAMLLDPFLNDWDEVYHAVVGRNLMDHPLTPMLHTEPAMPVTTLWSAQHIWLHKPPFFLWQIALSLKLFGLHPWAVRLPSVLWLTALVPAVWRIGQLLVNSRVGFLAAFILAFSFLPQELVAGTVNTDHNDAVFIALVGCACWAWLEFVQEPSRPWAVLVGAFSACAILTKWYVGGIVLCAWTVWVAVDHFKWPGLKGLLVAAVVAAIPVGAWLMHINRWFPSEASYEWGFKAQHFTYPVDGHRGSWSFHFTAIDELMPPFTWWMVLPAVAWFIWRVERAAHRILLCTLVFGVHALFMAAQTKMVSYTMVLLPIYMVAIATAISSIVEQIPGTAVRPWLVASSVVIISFFAFDPERIEARHTLVGSPLADKRWRQQKLNALSELEKLHRCIERSDKPVIFNVPRNFHLSFMFTYGSECWPTPPTVDDLQRLRSKGYTVFVLQDGLEPSTLPAGAILVPDSIVSISRDVRI